MKNLFLLFFTILFLNSCKNYCEEQETLAQSYIIIDEIKKSNFYPGLACYSIDNSKNGINLIWFYDSMDKFNVGDTLIFIKK